MRRLVCAALVAAALLVGCGNPSRPARGVWTTPEPHLIGHRLGVCASSPCGDYTVMLTWSVQSSLQPVTGYYITVNAAQIADTPSSPYDVYGLACGATYSIGVQAHDALIASDPPRYASYTTPACPAGGGGGGGGGGSAPTLQAEPVVSGTVATGDVLSTTTGTWAGSPTGYTYQWQDCANDGTSCSNITGATSSTYTVASGDAGHTIEALVTATNSKGSTQTGAPIVPLVDNFTGSSVDTNVWGVIDQVANTGDDEPECYLPSQVAEGSNSLTETYGYSSGGNTCPPAAGGGSSGGGDAVTTLSSGITGGVAITSIPINSVNSAYNPVAGTLTVSDGTNTDTWTATGPPSGGHIPVTSHAPSHSYSSGTAVNPTLSQDFISGDIQEESTAFTYGTVKVSAELPANPRTTWPAIWLLDASCQFPNNLSSTTCNTPEIDIAEGVTGNQTTVKENVYNTGLSNPCTSGTISNYATNFHTYEVDWSSGHVVFKIDGVDQTSCDVSSANVPSGPMFLIIDSSVENSGSETSADLPAATTVDYVHASH